MNIPFSLAISNTSPHGVLWNPWGAIVADSVGNTVLTNLGADLQERYSLLAPYGGCWVTGLTIVGDTDDAVVALGIYDTERSAFDLLYPIQATLVAGGGMVDDTLSKGSGLYLPLNATRVAVIKYTPVSGSVIVTGNVSIHVQQDAALGAFGTPLLGPTASIQSEADGNALLEESTGLPLLEE